MNDSTTLIVICKDNEKTITTTYQTINNLTKKHPCIDKVIYTDLNSKDLTITLLSLLINKGADQKNMIIKHKKTTTLGQAINNATKITTSKNIIITTAQKKNEIRQTIKKIKLLRKAHIITHKNTKNTDIAYKKNIIKFKPNNQIKNQIETLATKNGFRMTRIE